MSFEEDYIFGEGDWSLPLLKILVFRCFRPSKSILHLNLYIHYYILIFNYFNRSTGDHYESLSQYRRAPHW